MDEAQSKKCRNATVKTVISFPHLVEQVEGRFDKALVDLDLILGDIDSDQLELTLEGRQKISALSSACAALVHAIQTLSQENDDLKKNLCEVRQELFDALASKKVLEDELQLMAMRFHSLQCEHTAKAGQGDIEIIKKKLDKEITDFRREDFVAHRWVISAKQFEKENKRLRKYVTALQSELYGARLAAKYLDRELAGRIQQIQLLSCEILGEEHNRLWEQIEAEIHCHRHKTVVRTFRGRMAVDQLPVKEKNEMDKSKRSAKIREVKMQRNENEGLGISVTGGREYGVPIIITEIHSGKLTESCGQLEVGDAILSVNGIELWSMKHSDAVKTLSKQYGALILRTLHVSDTESDDENSLKVYADDGTEFNLYEDMNGTTDDSRAPYDSSNVEGTNKKQSASLTSSKTVLLADVYKAMYDIHQTSSNNSSSKNQGSQTEDVEIETTETD